MALRAADKKALRQKFPKCYVCEGLGLGHAGFEGYGDNQVQFDHGFAQGLVGGAQADLMANLRPIHAASGQPGPSDEGWEDTLVRNCHAGKADKFTGPEWIDRVRMQRLAYRTRYSDDLMKKRPKGAVVTIAWNDKAGTATFMGSTYPVMTQSVGGEPQPWRSFSTLVPPHLLWTDQEVQPRQAEPKRLAAMAWHLRSSPLLSPILARWSPEQGKILVFDGNHRLCAYMIARGDQPIPVTIFDGPDPLAFLAVAVEAHDNLTQLKYQYSDKALKYSALTASELHQATEQWGKDASEERAWGGLTTAEVRLRVIGTLSRHLEEQGKWRTKWRQMGLTDQSWNRVIEQYARTTAETATFDSARYLREPERANLKELCRILDEELFDYLADSHFSAAKASLKTKWWKRAHAVLASAVSQVAMDSMQLDNRPRYPAYSPEWSPYVRTTLREMVVNWRQSPAWNQDTAANNEADIDALLEERQFTEKYLRTSGKSGT